MANELTKIGPEAFEVANAYLVYGTVADTAEQMQVPQHEVVRLLQTREVKAYLDGVYLDMGYRNRNKLGALLDKILDVKLEEAEETGEYTKKDIIEIIQLIHKMRMDEIKTTEKTEVNNTVQIASFGDGGYGKVMERLLGPSGK